MERLIPYAMERLIPYAPTPKVLAGLVAAAITWLALQITGAQPPEGLAEALAPLVGYAVSWATPDRSTAPGPDVRELAYQAGFPPLQIDVDRYETDLVTMAPAQ